MTSSTTNRSRPNPVVLVPGAFLGGWAYDQVADRLREAGHDVLAHTLPGMADREAEDHPDLDVTAHIDDLVGLLEDHDLRDVVLVGHSYAGAVVTGAAARVPDRVARLVYLDASVPTDDGPLAAEGSPERIGMTAAAEAFDGRRMGLLPDELLTSHDLFGADDLTPAQLATFRERATPFPLACMTTPLPAGTAEGTRGIPRTFLRCARSGPAPWWTDAAQRRPDDAYVEAWLGHWPMWSAPDLVAELVRFPRTPPSAIDRYQTLFGADERTQLTTMLAFHRDAVVRKAAGLERDQLTATPVGSGTSLLGLIAHLAGVETRWVQMCVAGRTPQEAAADFADLPIDVPVGWDVDADPADVIAAYRRAAERSDAVLADLDLDDVAADPNAQPTIRWVHLHLIEETARHAGHADILRELVDGAIGE